MGPTGSQVHHDAPLSNLAIEAFASSQDYVAGRLFPIVAVSKESDEYYTIDKAAWLANHDDLRARGVAPNKIEFKVSSDSYRCVNHALREKNALEDLSNADAALQLREQSAMNITEALLRAREIRVASKVTSISNVGSGHVPSNKWNDYVNGDPISDVRTARAFIRKQTGLKPNVALLDEDTYEVVRSHPQLLEYFKVSGGQAMVTNAQLAEAFGVREVIIGGAVYNAAKLNAAASMVNIWGNNCLFAYVGPASGLKAKTLGVGMRWTPAGIAAPLSISRYLDPDPGVAAEWVQAGHYTDDKIVAVDLGYLISTTL